MAEERGAEGRENFKVLIDELRDSNTSDAQDIYDKINETNKILDSSEDLLMEIAESTGMGGRPETPVTPKPPRGIDEENEKDRVAQLANVLKNVVAKPFTSAIKGLGKGLGKMFDKLVPSGTTGNILKTLGTVVALGAIIKFLRSETWKKIKEQVIPALTTGLEFLYNNVLIPIKNFIVETFTKSWESIKKLFDSLDEAIQLFKEGEYLKAITTTVLALGTFFADIIDNLITGIYNLFADFFGLEKTDSVFGEIKRFAIETYDNIVKILSEKFEFVSGVVSEGWTNTKDFVKKVYDNIISSIKEAFEFVSGVVSEGWTNTTDFIKGIYDNIISSITGAFNFVTENLPKFHLFNFISEVISDIITGVRQLFGGDFTKENVLESLGLIFGGLFDYFTGAINIAINTIFDLFKFSKPEKPFRLSEFLFDPEEGMIAKAIKTITKMFTISKDFFAGIDLSGMAKRFVQNLLQSVLPPPDFLSFTTPEIDLGTVLGRSLGKIPGKKFDLNPIPSALYRLAGINPETGDLIKQETSAIAAGIGPKVPPEGLTTLGGSAAPNIILNNVADNSVTGGNSNFMANSSIVPDNVGQRFSFGI